MYIIYERDTLIPRLGSIEGEEVKLDTPIVTDTTDPKTAFGLTVQTWITFITNEINNLLSQHNGNKGMVWASPQGNTEISQKTMDSIPDTRIRILITKFIKDRYPKWLVGGVRIPAQEMIRGSLRVSLCQACTRPNVWKIPEYPGVNPRLDNNWALMLNDPFVTKLMKDPVRTDDDLAHNRKIIDQIEYGNGIIKKMLLDQFVEWKKNNPNIFTCRKDCADFLDTTASRIRADSSMNMDRVRTNFRDVVDSTTHFNALRRWMDNIADVGMSYAECYSEPLADAVQTAELLPLGYYQRMSEA